MVPSAVSWAVRPSPLQGIDGTPGERRFAFAEVCFPVVESVVGCEEGHGARLGEDTPKIRS